MSLKKRYIFLFCSCLLSYIIINVLGDVIFTRLSLSTLMKGIDIPAVGEAITTSLIGAGVLTWAYNYREGIHRAYPHEENDDDELAQGREEISEQGRNFLHKKAHQLFFLAICGAVLLLIVVKALYF